MTTHLNHHEVVIVGAGPVGLFLSCRLAQLGISCAILEKDASPARHSRSIGIHPPSLERLAEMGLADSILNAGVRIGAGWAYAGRRCLGRLSFSTCPPPFPFVLTIPQYQTEEILESFLIENPAVQILRGVQFTGCEQQENEVRFQTDSGSARMTGTCSFLVACDGKNSQVREQAGLTMNRLTYPDTYVMGDFEDHTSFGCDGYIFLCRAGLVESLPLPGSIRRWVVKTGPDDQEIGADDIRARVMERTGCDLGRSENRLLNHFRVHRALASSFVQGRVMLAGDAAHEMSPFGGQGMNVGWMDAWDLADVLSAVLRRRADADAALRGYNTTARRRAVRASQRAEWNMALGRERRWDEPRNALVWFLLHSPLQRILARAFTMRWL